MIEIQTNHGSSRAAPALNCFIAKTPQKHSDLKVEDDTRNDSRGRSPRKLTERSHKSFKMTSYLDRLDRIRIKIDSMQRDCDNLINEMKKLKADSKIFKTLAFTLSSRLSVKDRQMVCLMSEDEKVEKLKEIVHLEAELARLKDNSETFSDILLELEEERCIKLKRLEKYKRKHVELASYIGIKSPYTVKTDDKDDNLFMTRQSIETPTRSIVPKVLFYPYGMNALHEACNRNETEKILSLLYTNGDKLVMDKDSDDRTPLHYAVTNSNVSIEAISKIIEIGGKTLVVEKDCYGENALHIACQRKASIKIIDKLIENGGDDIIFAKDNEGSTPLHKCASMYNPSIEVISKLLTVGGEKLLMEKDNKGQTTLHRCACNGSSIDVVSKLIELGGKRLVMEKDKDEMTALHRIKCTKNASVSVVSKLLELGGRELIIEKDKSGKIPLHNHVCDAVFCTGTTHDIIRLLIDVGIEEQVGGEFSIGGIFNVAPDSLQFEIYEVWEDVIFPIIIENKSLMETQPILHAAIIGKAPPFIMRDLIDNLDCLTTRDSMGRYPIDVAISDALKWNGGMKEIVEGMAVKENRSIINVALHYGLKWSNHMKEILESSLKGNEMERDQMTGLELFMLAAVGDGCDLNVVYCTLTHNPQSL